MTKLIRLLLMLVLPITLVSCGGNNDSEPEDITGSWYGIRSYYNPVGGTKYQYLTLTFNANKTGELKYESPVSYAVSYFTYSVKGNKVYCYGVKADTYEEQAYEYTLELEISGDRLYPKTQYQNFILTRDGSVVTDGDGNEITSGEDHNEPEQPVVDEKSKIKELIKTHVKVASSYSDYFWHFNIESDLSANLPNKTLEYGIGHGDVGGGQVYINSKSDSYLFLTISQRKSGDKLSVKIDSPFWLYFFLGMEPSDDLTTTKCVTYYGMRLKLLERPYNDLTADEKQLLQSTKQYLDKYESQTKWSYDPSIWVKVNNDWYEVP